MAILNDNPVVLLVRHGTTAMNDPTNERIRGYSDVPLSVEGMAKVKNTAKFLQDQKFPIAHVISSPLQRGMMTASIIADARAKIVPNRGLLPWNLGRWTEQPVKLVAPLMDDLQANPDIKTPNGESYRSFYNRWDEALDRLLKCAEEFPEEIPVGVVHSRNLLALPSILGDKEIGSVPVKGGPAPASVTQISKTEDGWDVKVIWEEPE